MSWWKTALDIGEVIVRETVPGADIALDLVDFAMDPTMDNAMGVLMPAIDTYAPSVSENINYFEGMINPTPATGSADRGSADRDAFSGALDEPGGFDSFSPLPLSDPLLDMPINPVQPTPTAPPNPETTPLNPLNPNPDQGGVPLGYCEEPLFAETPFFDEKQKACDDEKGVICTLEKWIDEKAFELRTLRDKRDIRVERYEQECGPWPGCREPTPPPVPEATGSGASTTCGGCSSTPCGCSGHRPPNDDPPSDSNIPPVTTPSRPSRVRCTPAIVAKCCPKVKSKKRKTTTKTSKTCGPVKKKRKTVTKKTTSCKCS